MSQCAMPIKELPVASARTGWWLPWRPTVMTLCVLQLLAMPICVALCAWEVETIIGSQAICLLGLPLAIAGFRHPAIRWFGLSVIVATLFCWILIPAMGWGPSQAQRPITALLIAFECFMIPLGLIALHNLRSGGTFWRLRSWRFSLRTLMGVVLAVAVFSAILRGLRSLGGEFPVGVGITLAIASWIATLTVFVLAGLHRIDLRAFDRTLAESRRRLGRRIGMLREQRELTVEKVAQECRLSTSCLRRIECGKTAPLFDEIVLIAAALQVTPAQLLDYK